MDDDIKGRLIEKVHALTAVWDKRHYHYHNRHVLNKLWKKLASELGIPVYDAKKMWKNLRQEFGKQLKKQQKFGAAACTDSLEPQWIYYKPLTFLKDQFSLTQMDTSLKATEGTQEAVFLDYGNEMDESDIENAITTAPSPSTLQTPSPASDPTPTPAEPIVEIAPIPGPSSGASLGHKRRPTSQQAIAQALLDMEKEKLNYRRERELARNERKNPDSEHEDLSFFRSIMPHVKQLKAHQKIVFRIKVYQMLLDLLYSSNPS